MTQPIGLGQGEKTSHWLPEAEEGLSAGMAGWDPKDCLGSGVTVTFLSHILSLSLAAKCGKDGGESCPPPSFRKTECVTHGKA